MRHITASEIIENYDNILLDAFGVLVNPEGAISFAPEFIDELNKRNKNYYVVSNGSKFLSSKSAESYRKRGLDIEDKNVITSGSLLKNWFERNQENKAVKLLGPKESVELLDWAGATLVKDDSYNTLVICNQDGFKFPEDIDQSISEVANKVKSGENIRLILPNPDLIYPSSSGYGITSGSIAIMIEKSLEIILGDKAPKFEKLGKPYSPIFKEAIENLSGKTCMIGDQFETDVLGANNIGIDSILVETGICNEDGAKNLDANKVPTFILKNLKL